MGFTWNTKDQGDCVTHPIQQDFVREIMKDGHAVGKSVLELGSYNVNGTVRDFFYGADRYVGVDWREGPCVDHVSLFHDIPWDREFDILVSCNAFEHDPMFARSLAAGVRALKIGGEIILSAAGPEYPSHEIDCAPGATRHYKGIGPYELKDALLTLGVRGNVIVPIQAGNLDVFFHGVKIQ